jgi:Uncharacterised ACR, YagE family COG1723
MLRGRALMAASRSLSTQASAAVLPSGRVRVSAVFAGPVDIASMHREAVARWTPHLERGELKTRLDRDWVVLRVPAPAYSGSPDVPFPHTFLSASRRGSVVVVNTCGVRNDRNPRFRLRDLLHATSPRATVAAPDEASAPQEDLTVEVNPEALPEDKWCAMRDGTLVLRDLDMESVRIVNSCLGQTVHLQYYEARLDAMHDLVGDIHRSLESSTEGSLSSWMMPAKHMRPSALFQHLGTINSISNSIMLSGLRTTMRPGMTAWNEDRYTQLHELLWEEFDLDERYEELQEKLEYIDDAIRYSLDVAKDAKSLFLERVIVLLIFAELSMTTLSHELPSKLLHFLSTTFSS